MNEVFIDLRKYDLSDRLGVDLISVDDLLNQFEMALDEIKELEEELKKKNEPQIDPYDEWVESQWT